MNITTEQNGIRTGFSAADADTAAGTPQAIVYTAIAESGKERTKELFVVLGIIAIVALAHIKFKQIN